MSADPGTDYDAVVVGSGPNGLAAAITLQRRGLAVLLIEGKDTVGGGMRSADLTLPGFTHDVCSAVHPLASESPFFNTLPLEELGLEFIYPPLCAAHPLDRGGAGILESSVSRTAHRLGPDGNAYRELIEPLVVSWPEVANAVLGPLRVPKHPLSMARFGLTALRSAASVVKRFKGPEARGLWAGMAAHSMLPLSFTATSAIAIVLAIAGHRKGWPVAKGGSQAIANALAAYFVRLGGKIETGRYARSISELPSAKVVLLDITPKQALAIAGKKFSEHYTRQLQHYRYGMGIYKIDWALSQPVPFVEEACTQAGTVHLGGTFEEIAHSEEGTWNGKVQDRPFVLLAQPSRFDSSRAPDGKHTAWAYCHVPNGSTANVTGAIESQVERFAPGFRDCILARHVMNASQVQEYNENYIGGDINGGAADITQLFTRPALRLSPYRTSAKGIYLCSSSTPPGGGVHGMCGYHAAMRAFKDHWTADLTADFQMI